MLRRIVQIGKNNASQPAIKIHCSSMQTTYKLKKNIFTGKNDLYNQDNSSVEDIDSEFVLEQISEKVKTYESTFHR